MKKHRPWVAPIAFAAATLALTSTATADKLVVFKNGKVMLAKSVTWEADWLKCEFEGGNFMSIPRKGVATIEESTLPEGARGGPVNQLIDGPRGAANMGGGGGGGGDVDTPRGAGRAAAQMEPPPVDDDEEMRRAVAEEAEARRGFAGRNRAGLGGQQQNGLQQQQQQNEFQPIPGLNQVPGMTPITAPSTNLGGKKRTIGRRADRGNATQLPGQQQPVPNE